MNDFVKGVISGIIVAIIGGLIVFGVTYKITYNLSKIDTRKIIAYLPYANDYFYANGKTYKNATPSPSSQMARDIDPNEPIPLNINKSEQKFTIGVKNLNSKTIDDVRIFLEIPQGIKITEYTAWTMYSDVVYYISLGNINSGVGHNAIQPIFFKTERTGTFEINYSVTGRNFEPFRRQITFNVY